MPPKKKPSEVDDDSATILKNKFVGRYRIQSRAQHSKTFTGTIDHGTFSEAEFKANVVRLRMAELELRGYKNVHVVEINIGGTE